MKAPSERRRSERIFTYLPLEYRVRNGPYVHAGHVVNASAGGFLIYSNKDIPVGVRLSLELSFPKGYECNNFVAEVETVWKDDGPGAKSEGEKFQYGIRFTEISEEGLKRLKQLLSGRLQRETRKNASSGFVNIEMRRYPRHAVDLPVECFRVNSPISHTGRAINASEGGLMLYLPEKVEIGQHLKLMLSVGSEHALDTIDMIAQAVWVDIGSSIEDYRVGVMIVDISPADRLKLKELLENLLE